MDLLTGLIILGSLFAIMAGGWLYICVTMKEPEYMRSLRNNKSE